MYIINTMFILYNSVYKISNTKLDNINPIMILNTIFLYHICLVMYTLHYIILSTHYIINI